MHTLSASQIKTLQCPRKWEFSYHEKLESTKVSEALLFGSAFHAGMSAALVHHAKGTGKDLVYVAVHEAGEYLHENDPQDEFISIDDIQARLQAMFIYYIPLVGLGTKYRVAAFSDVFECSTCYGSGEIPCDCTYINTKSCACDGDGLTTCPDCVDTLMIEYNLEVPITPRVECSNCGGGCWTGEACGKCGGHGADDDNRSCTYCAGTGDQICKVCDDGSSPDGYAFIGYVDAILVDLETNELVIVDWKTVATPRDATTAMLDGQLQLYAAALQQQGVDINRVCMWQMRKDVPKPARLLKNGQPSEAVQATTLAKWVDTLPMDVSTLPTPKGYASHVDWAADKLKPEDHFNNPVEMFVSSQQKGLAWRNLEATVWMVKGFRKRLEETPLALPAIQNGGFAGACTMCQFRELCITLQAGDNPTAIIAEKYRSKS